MIRDQLVDDRRKEVAVGDNANFFDLYDGLRKMIARNAISTYLAGEPLWLSRWEANDPRTRQLEAGKGFAYQGRILAENVIAYRLSINWSNAQSRANQSPTKATARKRLLSEDHEDSKDCQSPNCGLCGSIMVLKCADGCDDVKVLSYTALLTGRLKKRK